MKVFKTLSLIGVGASCLWGLMTYLAGEKQVTLTLSNSNSSTTLALPLKDRKRLEYAFHEFISHDDFAYTLLGNKPISFGTFLKPFGSFKLPLLYQSLLPHNLKMYWAWHTWLKYASFFKNPGYRLWIEKSPWIENGELIVLANTAAFFDILTQYHEDFQKVLGEKSIGEAVWSEIGHKGLFLEILQGHEGLIGTLLGYGRDNAWLFWERTHKPGLIITNVWGEKIESEMIAQLNFFNSILHASKKSNPLFVFYPIFVGDPSSQETLLLQKKYQTMRTDILNFYEGKDFLETTLSLLKYGPLLLSKDLSSQMKTPCNYGDPQKLDR